MLTDSNLKSLFVGAICLLNMEGEEDYLETEDVRKLFFEHLKSLGKDAELIDIGKLDIEKKPYYSFYFSGRSRMVDNVGCIKVKGQNFDYIHLLRLG